MGELHTRGKRQRHKFEVVREPIAEGQMYCSDCKINVGHDLCEYCHQWFCNGCWHWHELNVCKDKPDPDDIREIVKATCVECGKFAERICNQCGDCYCNWRSFGNPGCFEYYHRK